MQAFSAVILLLVFLPMSIGAAWGVWFLSAHYAWLAPDVGRAVLTFLYLVWALTPLLGFSLNESYDLTKLFAYPISYRQIFLGSVLGSLLDMPTLLALPTLVVLLFVFSPSVLAFLLNLLLIVAFLLHTLALGQAITLALVGFLRSRRFRDITIVLFPLLGLTYYVGQRLFFQNIDTLHYDRFLSSPLWRVAGWLPPGWGATGLTAASHNQWGLALLTLLGLVGIGALTLWVAASTLKNLYLGDSGPLHPRPAVSTPKSPAMHTVNQDAPTGLWARLPSDVAAMAGKEFVYFRREPQYKALAVNVVYTVVIVAMSILLQATGHGRHRAGLVALGDWLFFGLSTTLIVAMSPLLFNIFGGEGAAVTMLFSFPTRRRAMLLGKNLAHLSVYLGINIIGLVAIATVSGRWDLLPAALAWVIIAAPVLLAAGNLVSIRFPHQMLVRGQRWQRGGVATISSGNNGCAYVLLYSLVYPATFIALLPVIAAILIPRHFGLASAWFALTLPLAAAYSGGLYIILLGQAETWLMAREPEIAQRIAPTD